MVRLLCFDELVEILYRCFAAKKALTFPGRLDFLLQLRVLGHQRFLVLFPGHRCLLLGYEALRMLLPTFTLPGPQRPLFHANIRRNLGDRRAGGNHVLYGVILVLLVLPTVGHVNSAATGRRFVCLRMVTASANTSAGSLFRPRRWRGH
ncbi:hypothetical protein AU252_22780 [Pseudarthrobacter sulfonivorans]|uniref:Uncharacterized protein n=1 Tax=Pseudarthrobacter sulfonivorans TaxID=121292 RepID=A0A0U3QGS0_9MICC|nr:hypothetical protein AU252_22780 [Pseudarthrobacter sulfonivorans]